MRRLRKIQKEATKERSRSATSDSLQKRLRQLELRKQLLLGMKLSRVYAPPAAAQPYGMLQVQHLVVNDVLDGVAGNQELVEDAADHDRIVRRIVMPEDAARLGRAPTHARTAQQSMKEAAVQILEDRIEIVDAALRRMQPLASAHLPHQVRLAHNFMAAHIFSIAGRVAAVDRLAIHLGQQDVGDGAHYSLRRAFKQIGKPHQQPAFAQANCVVDIGEGKKLDLQLRRRGSGTQLPVFFMKKFEQSLAHDEARLSRLPPSGARPPDQT